jgi:hypothetical protein
MANIKLKNILAENMRRFGTKNLNETQLDMFKKSDDEYFLDRPEFDDHDIHYEDLAYDLKKAIKKQDGRMAIKVANELLKYITVDIYKNLDSDYAKQNPGYVSILKGEIENVEKVNQDVIKDAINILKVSPKNVAAMQTIYNIIDDLWSYVD